MPRARGGRRQGTPGKGYSNRTDLATDYAPGSPASGGMVTLSPHGVEMQSGPAGPAAMPSAPEDTPMLSDPTNRPDEPITAGLRAGPGPGPVSPRQQAVNEISMFKPYLPLLEAEAESGNAAPSFVLFVRTLRNA